MASKLAAMWNHPAGPKTIHFWAPTFKWGISIANIADFSKPPETISYAQQMAVTTTGVIWSRYAMVIVPKNYNLFAVNIAMGITGIYQLTRKIRQDYMDVPGAPLKKATEKSGVSSLDHEMLVLRSVSFTKKPDVDNADSGMHGFSSMVV